MASEAVLDIDDDDVMMKSIARRSAPDGARGGSFARLLLRSNNLGGKVVRWRCSRTSVPLGH